jgi:hypothetical protein
MESKNKARNYNTKTFEISKDNPALSWNLFPSEVKGTVGPTYPAPFHRMNQDLHRTK